MRNNSIYLKARRTTNWRATSRQAKKKGLWQALFCFFVLAFGLMGAYGFSAPTKHLESLLLYVGVQYDYPLPEDLKGKKLKFEGPFRRYTGLSHNVAENMLRFTPKRTGVSALNIKDPKGRILKKLALKVGKTNLQQTATEIQSLLRMVDGIQIKILNNRVVIDGEILVPKDMRRIHDVVQEYKGKATSLVALSPLAQKKVAKFIEREINNPNVAVRSANGVLILEGTVETLKDKARAEEIAYLYLPDHIMDAAVGAGRVKEWKRKPVINYIVAKEERRQKRKKPKDDRKKLIQLVVHYVELNKNYSDSFRFQWAPQIADNTHFMFQSGTSGLGSVGGMIAGTINNFLPKLNWAKSFGFARILHSANVITEENQTATINSTTMTPFLATQGANGEQTVAVSDTGVQMSIQPKVVGPRKDSVRLSNIKFRVRDIVGSTGNSPITTNRSLNTNIYVQNGLSAVIGGVISNSTFSDYNREPPNSSGGTPLLSFLSSKKFNRTQSQFVVFVTPIIKSSASSGVSRIKQKFKLSGR